MNQPEDVPADSPNVVDSDAQPTPAPATDEAPEFTKEELRLAMKAFRKRIKLMRLDEESSLGYGPMSSGSKSSIAAIRPPDQFPAALWRELANQGKLRREAGGLYAIVES